MENSFEAGQIVSDLSGNRDHNCGRLAKPTVIFSLGFPINVLNFIRLKEVTNLKLWHRYYTNAPRLRMLQEIQTFKKANNAALVCLFYAPREGWSWKNGDFVEKLQCCRRKYQGTSLTNLKGKKLPALHE